MVLIFSFKFLCWILYYSNFTAFTVSFGGVKDKQKSKSALVKKSTSLTGEMSDPLVVNDGEAK